MRSIGTLVEDMQKVTLLLGFFCCCLFLSFFSNVNFVYGFF